MRLVVLYVLLCVPSVLSAETLVNINTASAEELETLPGIGSAYATRIIEYRSDAPFQTIEDIQNVSGIGPATFAKIEDHITVDGEKESDTKETTTPSKSVRVKETYNEEIVVDAPAVTFVHQEVSFDVSTHMSGRLVRYAWNFGDLSSGEGRAPTHRFEYPGEYVVIVEGRYQGEDFSARHEIVVLPVAFSITRSPEGDIQIHNDASEEVDISHFILSEVDAVVIPKGTTLLPHATLTVPREKVETGGTYGIPRLYDAIGTLVATYDPQYVAPESDIVPVDVESQQASAIEAVEESGSNLAYIGLASVLAIGILGVYTRRRESPYIEDIEKSV
ncbi:helix-hairpin-helix domain-containing protein [Candidatus Kaiserbacteria bacterium]|nr:helix-hairpin-helix domain-containing protein [Candidatus Kaiserbacteria bacterium]